MRVRQFVRPLVCAVFLPGLLCSAPAFAAHEAGSATAGNHAFKIGVVNRSQALSEYTKQKKETAMLQREKNRLQAPIDALTKEIEADKKYYEDHKSKMSDDQRQAYEDKVQEKFRSYQALLSTGQGKIDLLRKRSLETLIQDYDKAVKQVSQAGGYGLVLESDATGLAPTVLYSSETINITPQVIEYLNSHTKSSATASGKSKSSTRRRSKKERAR